MMKADMLAALGMSKPRIRRKKGGGSKGLRRAGSSSSSSSSSNSSNSSSSEVYSDSETIQDDGEQAGRSRGNSSMHPRVSTPSNRRPPMAAAAAAALASLGIEGQHDQWDRGDDEPQNVESISSFPLDVQPPVAKGSVTLSLAQMKEMCRGRYEPIYQMYTDMLAEMQDMRIALRSQEEIIADAADEAKSTASLIGTVASALTEATASSADKVGRASPQKAVAAAVPKGILGQELSRLSASTVGITRQLQKATSGMAEGKELLESREKADLVIQQAVEACKAVAKERDEAVEAAGEVRREMEELRVRVDKAEKEALGAKEEARVVQEARKIAEAQARKSAQLAAGARLEKEQAVREREEVFGVEGERDAAVIERDAAVGERNALLNERDELAKERDAAVESAQVCERGRKEAEGEVERVKEEVGRLEGVVEGLRGELERMEEERGGGREERERERDEAKIEVEALRREVEELERERREAVEREREAREVAEGALLEGEGHRAEVDRAREMARELEAQLEDARERLITSLEEAEETSKRTTLLVDEAERCKDEAFRSASAASTARAERDRAMMQAQSAAVARDRAGSEVQGLREEVARLKAEVEGLSRPSNKINRINSQDTDNSINNGVPFAEQCPNCGYSIATAQAEEHPGDGHHHFLSMSKVSQSEQAILSIEKRLADESQPYPASPRRAPEEYLAESVGGWGDLDGDAGRGGWKDDGQQGQGYEDSRSLLGGGYDVSSSHPRVQRGEDANGAVGEGGGKQGQNGALPYSTVPVPKGLQVMTSEESSDTDPDPNEGNDEDGGRGREWHAAGNDGAYHDKRSASPRASNGQVWGDERDERGEGSGHPKQHVARDGATQQVRGQGDGAYHHASHRQEAHRHPARHSSAGGFGVEAKREARKRQAGVGLMLMQDAGPDGQFEVYIDGCQSQEAFDQGARIGDVVRAIDGQDMTGRRAFEVRGKLLGAAGTSVVVTLQRSGLCLCGPGVDVCDCMGMFDLELTR